MDKLFNSKFMVTLQKYGQKLATNTFIQSLQAGMGSLLGIITVGSIFQVFASLANESGLGWFKTGDAVYNMITLPFNFGFYIITIWQVVFIAYHYAKNLKMKSPIIVAMDAVVTFMIVAGAFVTTKDGGMALGMDYLGSQGMFIGFFVVYVVVRIEKFCYDRNIRIKMPDVVPPFLQDSFAAVLPFFFSTVFFLGLSGLVGAITKGAHTLPSGFMALLRAPLGAASSVWGIGFLCMLALLLWTFGIHGNMIVLPIISPLGIAAATANAELHKQGLPMQFYPVFLYASIALVGGTGNTLSLVLLGLKSKSKQIRAVSRISIIPGWFGINEPVTFGMPIMFNPILAIPYILNVPIAMVFSYFAYKTGFIIPQWIAVSAQLPMGFQSYFSTLHWGNFVWDYFLILPTMLVYYPFFKMYEKQLVEKERAAEAEALAATAAEGGA